MLKSTKLKVVTIVGTRPEVIKLSRVIAELEMHTDHVLVHTGQNYDYELNDIFFDELGVKKPDYFLEVDKSSACRAVGDVIAKAEMLLSEVKPDAVLIYGDTNSCLCVYAAKRLKIPVFHMEAGNRCFDERVPEEINRRIIDHISDINMTISEHARQYLIAEGIKPNTIIKVGSCMAEIFNYYQHQIENSAILHKLNLTPRQYLLLSFHREENVDVRENLIKILNTLQALSQRYQMPLIISTHPRTRKRLEQLSSEIASLRLDDNVQFLLPFGFCDYARLQRQAFCVLSDSGSLTEDASVLDFPAVTIREQHERPEGMDVATLLMSGLEQNRMLQAVELATLQHETGSRNFAMVPDYCVENVSRKVVRIILSHVDYINRTVWFKQELTPS